jgi:hypothetical protein
MQRFVCHAKKLACPGLGYCVAEQCNNDAMAVQQKCNRAATALQQRCNSESAASMGNQAPSRSLLSTCEIFANFPGNAYSNKEIQLGK